MARFVQHYPGVNPIKIKLVTLGDFEKVKSILASFEKQIRSVPQLTIELEDFELTSESISYIFSFPNLIKLNISSTGFRKVLKEFSRELSRHESLEEITFSKQGLNSWSKLQLKDNLKYLDMSLNVGKNICEMTIPSSLTYLSMMKVDLDNDGLRRISSLPNLTILKVSYNNLTSINVSQLLETLQTIDLSVNDIQNFEFDHSKPCWPHGLKCIDLGFNQLNSESLKQLCAIDWPPYLQSLNLCSSELTSLELLKDLPCSIKTLDVSRTKVETLKIDHLSGGYPYFRFPVSLETFNMTGCGSGIFEKSTYLEEQRFRFGRAIEFPPGLKHLDLSSCKITDLRIFKFPPSIKSLHLSTNWISDLMHSVSNGGLPDVEWQSLTNLNWMYLQNNHLRDLHDWIPPPSVRELDVSLNSFEKLSVEHFPIFDERFHQNTVNLPSIKMRKCQIDRLSSKLTLPPNLLKWDISENRLPFFVFTDKIASHENLLVLNLSLNDIYLILVESMKEYSMNLVLLDIYANNSLEMTREQLNGLFQRLGLVEVRSWQNDQMHYFVRRSRIRKGEQLDRISDLDVYTPWERSSV